MAGVEWLSDAGRGIGSPRYHTPAHSSGDSTNLSDNEERVCSDTAGNLTIRGRRFMETVLPYIQTVEEQETSLTVDEDALRWLYAHLSEPRINGLKGSAISGDPADSTTNLRWMRALQR